MMPVVHDMNVDNITRMCVEHREWAKHTFPDYAGTEQKPNVHKRNRREVLKNAGR